MAMKLLMAKSPEEAISFKTAAAAFLAGGTEVNRLGSDAAAGAETLISLKKCSGLDGISEKDGYVNIGSMCTFQQLVESDTVPGWLKEAARFMACLEEEPLYWQCLMNVLITTGLRRGEAIALQCWR